jgi:CRISPR-associated protein Cas5t
MNKVRVVRVIVEAAVTSFRYPHFLIGRQPTHDMPPPSTIYGHIASALGELPDPASFRFGYDFTSRSRGSDLEHQHIISAGGAKFTAEGKKHTTSVQATIQPHARDFLFGARLTLYVTRPEWAVAFRAPAFCVVLGRSQDLASVTAVDEVELEERTGAYMERTILPFSYRPYIGVGRTVLMPKYIGPPPERRAEFDRFIPLRERMFAGDFELTPSLSQRFRMLGEAEPSWWVDPTTTVVRGVQRAVILHSCV